MAKKSMWYAYAWTSPDQGQALIGRFESEVEAVRALPRENGRPVGQVQQGRLGPVTCYSSDGNIW